MLAAQQVNGGDTAWVMVCAGLVLFMVFGLAVFYAGMVRSRNALTMMQQNIVPLGVVSILWVLAGYSLAFSTDTAGLIGDLELFGLGNLGTATAPAFHLVVPGITIPTLAFVGYQMMFAVITPALITGATAARVRAGGWILFLALWTLIVYAPVAHWLWGPRGWLARLGAQDWAGGMVVHTSAGAAVVAVLLVVGRRRMWPRGETVPHSIPLTIVGAGILWFGWFGFNAGDGLQANGIAAQALINTHLAAAGGLVVWLVVERVREGHATVLGSVTGAVAGLATITPCAGYVSTLEALAIGAIAGILCHTALNLKSVFRLDDALDVIAVHFVGGVLGSVLLGFFAQKSINSVSANGLFHGGGVTLLWHQVVAVVAVAAFAFVLTWLIAQAVARTVGLRVDPADEARLDQVQQGASAYHLDHVANLPGSALPGAEPPPSDAVPVGAPAGTGAGGSRLITTLIDPYHVDARALTDALSAAGATSITVAEVHQYTSTPRQQMIRGQRRLLDFADRLRVEILVPGERLPQVRRALAGASRQPGSYLQITDPADDR